MPVPVIGESAQFDKQASLSTTKPNIIGTYTYSYIPGLSGNATVGFGVSQLQNPSSTRTTGTLRLELWAFTSPYTGSGSGYRIATYQIGGTTNGQLAPGQSFTNIEGAATFLGNPPSGSYYMTLLVTEYSTTCTASDHFCSDNYENFPTLFTPGKSLTDIASTTSNTSGGSGSTIHIGAVFSTSQSASQSFLRFYNTGTTAGTVTVTLSDYNTGQSLGQWTSPSIAVGAAPQYSMGTIETGLSSGVTKPTYYSVAVQSGITGYFQHVLWRPSRGTFTNLSTCNAGVTANADKLNNVHSSAIDSGYPSSVIVNNTGTSAETVTLGIYGATDGAKLGTYLTASIPAGGQTIIAMKTIEAALNITPGSVGNHYVVKAEGAFTGFLQHLVQNVQVDVTTDMTTVCSLSGVSSTAVTSPLKIGAVFSTSQSASQSFLRFYNTGTTAGTVTVTLSDYNTGQSLGQWTSPSIAVGAAPQYSMGTIETGLSHGVTKPTYYSVAVQSGITGYFQHVLWRPSQGTFTNLSTCNAGVTTNADKLNNVHSSAIDSGYPSSVIVNNTGTSAETVTLGIYGATDGAKLGTYLTASIPAGGQTIIAMKTIEAALNITPGSVGNHYVVKAEGAFTGFLQHLVQNVQADVTTDMTTVCALPVSAGGTATYNLVTTTAGTGSGTITNNPTGQILVTGTAVYASGTIVTLTESANAFNQSVFTGWSGACSGTATTCQVTMDSNKTVTANFSTSTSGVGGAETWVGTLTGQATPYCDGFFSDGIFLETATVTIIVPAPGLVSLLTASSAGTHTNAISGTWSDVETVYKAPTPGYAYCPFPASSSTGTQNLQNSNISAFANASYTNPGAIHLETGHSLYPLNNGDTANANSALTLGMSPKSISSTSITGTWTDNAGGSNGVYGGNFTLTKQ